MALTNGITLWNKIKTIADAIRSKTHKTNSLTIDQMVSEINNEWKITCFVKDFYIQDDGNHGEGRDGDWDERLDFNVAESGSGVALSYTLDGKVALTARSLSGSFENVQWKLDSAPAGVSLIYHSWSYSASPSGNSGQYQTCFLKGINNYCRVIVWCGDRDTNKDMIDLWVKVEYI